MLAGHQSDQNGSNPPTHGSDDFRVAHVIQVLDNDPYSAEDDSLVLVGEMADYSFQDSGG